MGMIKKRGRRPKLSIVKVIAIAAALLAVAFCAVFFGFQTKEIQIKGNDYTSEEEILEVIGSDSLSSNTLGLLFKYRFTNYELPKSLTSMKMDMVSPSKVVCTVKEKSIVGYLEDAAGRIYFDRDGVVVFISNKKKYDVPKIEGLDTGSAKLYSPINVRDEKLLTAMLGVAKELNNFKLNPDRIVCAEDGMELFFGQIRVLLGTDITTEKMAQISPILAKLEGKTGILHLEHFTNNSKTVTFTEGPIEDEVPGEDDEKKDDEESGGGEDNVDAEDSEDAEDAEDGGDAEDKEDGEDWEDSEDWEDDSEDDYDPFEGYTLDEDGYYYGADGYLDSEGNFYYYPED